MNVSATGLRVVLALLGAFVVFSGLDMALGGFMTLGWMEQSVFFEVVDQAKFQEADNHQRFLGGVWTGLGLIIWSALADLRKYRVVLISVFFMVFIGGLARFSQMNVDVLLLPGVLWAAVVELIGMPLMYLWLSRTLGQPSAASEPEPVA